MTAQATLSRPVLHWSANREAGYVEREGCRPIYFRVRFTHCDAVEPHRVLQIEATDGATHTPVACNIGTPDSTFDYLWDEAALAAQHWLEGADGYDPFEEGVRPNWLDHESWG